MAAILVFLGVGKLRRDPYIVKVIHETVGVPMKYFPILAACEFAGAAGPVLGISLPIQGLTAVSRSLFRRAGDAKGIGPAAFLLSMPAGAALLRALAHKTFL